MHIHQMPPVWLDQIQLRPKTKSEEMDFEKLREAAAQEAERLATERDKQNRQSADQKAAFAKRRKGGSNSVEEVVPEYEEAPSSEALPIKINLVA